MVECKLAGEVFTIEVQQYPRAFMSTLKQGAPQPTLTDQSALPGIPDPTLRTDNRMNYKDMNPLIEVTCATHAYGVQDEDSPQMWEEIIAYLKNNTLPTGQLVGITHQH